MVQRSLPIWFWGSRHLIRRPPSSPEGRVYRSSSVSQISHVLNSGLRSLELDADPHFRISGAGTRSSTATQHPPQTARACGQVGLLPPMGCGNPTGRPKPYNGPFLSAMGEILTPRARYSPGAAKFALNIGGIPPAGLRKPVVHRRNHSGSLGKFCSIAFNNAYSAGVIRRKDYIGTAGGEQSRQSFFENFQAGLTVGEALHRARTSLVCSGALAERRNHMTDRLSRGDFRGAPAQQLG